MVVRGCSCQFVAHKTANIESIFCPRMVPLALGEKLDRCRYFPYGSRAPVIERGSASRHRTVLKILSGHGPDCLKRDTSVTVALEGSRAATPGLVGVQFKPVVHPGIGSSSARLSRKQRPTNGEGNSAIVVHVIRDVRQSDLPSH
jgi:hypothetical protein